MHPIKDLFLESFSYVLQIDMHFICTPMWTKKIILVKIGDTVGPYPISLPRQSLKQWG
jgi:hypothetical protein